MTPHDRHDRIIGLLAHEAEGRLDVNDLARNLGVSRETIRRDLNKLAEQGLLQKVHGGAVRFQRAQERAFALRQLSNRAAKVAIGRRAAELLEPGDSLFIDAGSTTILFSQQLAELSGLTVITNSVAVAAELANGPHANNVHLLGGTFNSEIGETLGPMVLSQVRQFHADHAFLGIGGLTGDGTFTDFDLDEAHVARAMIAQAGSTTILIDSSKVGTTSLVEVCTSRDIDRVVTEAAVRSDIRQVLERDGVEVCLAG